MFHINFIAILRLCELVVHSTGENYEELILIMIDSNVFETFQKTFSMSESEILFTRRM